MVQSTANVNAPGSHAPEQRMQGRPSSPPSAGFGQSWSHSCWHRPCRLHSERLAVSAAWLQAATQSEWLQRGEAWDWA